MLNRRMFTSAQLCTVLLRSVARKIAKTVNASNAAQRKRQKEGNEA